MKEVLIIVTFALWSVVLALAFEAFSYAQHNDVLSEEGEGEEEFVVLVESFTLTISFSTIIGFQFLNAFLQFVGLTFAARTPILLFFLQFDSLHDSVLFLGGDSHSTYT